jgi:release factor glutamine methyltransferase
VPSEELHLEYDPRVYTPSDDSELLVNNLAVKQSDVVLEIGVGTGYVSLVAAKKASIVVGIDINPFAVQLAARNASLNDITNVHFIRGDLFDPLKDMFDVIIFNPPYLPDSNTSDELAYAWCGGESGHEVIDRFLNSFDRYLNSGGRMQLVQSSLSGYDGSINDLRRKGYDVRITDRLDLFFETLILLTVIKTP